MKRVYVAEVQIKDADRFDVAICETMELAVDAIEMDKAHTTVREAKDRIWSVSAWDIPCADGQDIKSAYIDWVSDLAWTPDPVEYKEM